MNTLSSTKSAHRLEKAVQAFFSAGYAQSVWRLCVDPSIYAQSLALTSTPTERYPWPVTLFVFGIAVLITLLIFGVRRGCAGFSGCCYWPLVPRFLSFRRCCYS